MSTTTTPRAASAILTLAALAVLIPILALPGCASYNAQQIAPEWPADARAGSTRFALAWTDELAQAGEPKFRLADPAWAALVEACRNADVVLIGEIHGHSPGLEAAAALFQDIVATRRNRTPSLALEFLERDHQVHIDDYLLGYTDEDTFRERTNRTDKNYEGHRDMVELAKANTLAVKAANAPRRYVRLVRLQGPDIQLTPEQARLVEIPRDLADAGYMNTFADLMSAMRGHSEDDEAGGDAEPADPLADPMILSFYRSQNVWDVTMADTVLDLVQDNQRPAVLVVGQFHTDNDGGLTRRVRAGLNLKPGDPRLITISMVPSNPPQTTPLHSEDNGRATAIIYTGPLAGAASQPEPEPETEPEPEPESATDVPSTPAVDLPDS